MPDEFGDGLFSPRIKFQDIYSRFPLPHIYFDRGTADRKINGIADPAGQVPDTKGSRSSPGGRPLNLDASVRRIRADVQIIPC